MYLPKDKIMINNGSVLSSYTYEDEILQAISRAQYEGFTIPDTRRLVALNTLIKGMKAQGLWQKQDVFLNFAYNNTNLFGFSRINLKRPWSRTNLVKYSTDFSNAVWTYPSATISPNTGDTTAPDGTNTACKLQNLGVASTSQQTGIIANSSILTYSIYLKGGTATTARVSLRDDTAAIHKAFATLTFSTGTLSSTQGTTIVQNVGSGWYRVTVTATDCVVGNSYRIYIGDRGNQLNGDNWYVWGAQVEDRGIATPYLATGATPIYGNGVATTQGSVSYTVSGWKGDGSTGFIDPRFNPLLTALNYTQNDAATGVVSYQGGSISNTLVGEINNAAGRNSLAANLVDNRINSTNGLTFTTISPAGSGMKVLVRTSSSSVTYHIKATNETLSNTSTALASEYESIFKRGTIFGDAGVSLYFKSSSMNATDVANLRTLYNAYLVKIGLTAFA